MVRAKWFPLCEYLLKNKGVDFVKGVVKDFPGLKRPTISNPPPENKLQGLQKLVKNQPPAKRQPPFPPFIDPRGVRDVKEKVEREMLLGKNVEMAKLLGFQDQQLAQVLTKRFKEHKNNFATFYNFMQKLMEKPEVDVESKLTMKRAKAILDEVK